MAYDRHQLAVAVRRRLVEKPATPLKAVVEAEGVERHTITEALQEAFGLSFRQLQNACIIEVTADLFKGAHQMSIKQTALEMGFSDARTFARRYRRITGRAPVEGRRRVKLGPVEARLRFTGK